MKILTELRTLSEIGRFQAEISNSHHLGQFSRFGSDFLHTILKLVVFQKVLVSRCNQYQSYGLILCHPSLSPKEVLYKLKQRARTDRQLQSWRMKAEYKMDYYQIIPSPHLSEISNERQNIGK